MRSKMTLIILLGLATLATFYAFNPLFHSVDAAGSTVQELPPGPNSVLGTATKPPNQAGTPIAAGTIAPGTPLPAASINQISTTTGTINATAVVNGTPTITTTGSITTTGFLTATATSTLEKTNALTGTPTITATVQITSTPSSTPLPPIFGEFKPRETVRSILPRVLQAVVIVLIGWLLAILARRAVNRALVGIHPEVRFFLGRLAFAGVLVGSVIWALSVLQVYFATLATILGTVGLAVSLASQDLIKNLVAGVYLLLEHPFGVGDRVTIGGYTGRVMIIDLRTTMLHTDDNQDVLVPNTLIMSQVVVKQLEVVETQPADQEAADQAGGENSLDETSERPQDETDEASPDESSSSDDSDQDGGDSPASQNPEKIP